VVYKFDITHLTATYEIDGDTVTVTGLEDLNVFRYAQGTYTSNNAVKAAAGSKSILPGAVTNNTITLTGLSGTYTFVAKYNDSSEDVQTFTFD